jgi:predicted amidophosphoribosyltransferase
MQRSLDLISPPGCVGCQRELEGNTQGHLLCPDCLDALSGYAEPVCPRCAARVPLSSVGEASCPRCEQDRLRFDGAFALGRYEGLLRELVLKMKADRTGLLPRLFASLLVERYGDRWREMGLDAVTAIPIGRWKRLVRGVNPSAQLATEIARLLQRPLVSGLLRWTSSPLPQHGLSQPGRFRNVQGRFRLGVGYHLEAPRILLVDDVLTSGATCSEAARTLKRRGAHQVFVAVVGRTQSE